jgi:hypothetical protein
MQQFSQKTSSAEKKNTFSFFFLFINKINNNMNVSNAEKANGTTLLRFRNKEQILESIVTIRVIYEFASQKRFDEDFTKKFDYIDESFYMRFTELAFKFHNFPGYTLVEKSDGAERELIDDWVALCKENHVPLGDQKFPLYTCVLPHCYVGIQKGTETKCEFRPEYAQLANFPSNAVYISVSDGKAFYSASSQDDKFEPLSISLEALNLVSVDKLSKRKREEEEEKKKEKRIKGKRCCPLHPISEEVQKSLVKHTGGCGCNCKRGCAYLRF